MGLDITAYSKLVLVSKTMDGDESYDQGLASVYPNPDFPLQADGLSEGAYKFERELDFRAGSYSGYNAWRDQLEGLNCWPAFAELVNFSDCEGTIGPVTSAKLAQDFAAHQAKADAAGGWFLELYNEWRQAFELAADNGAVSFH